MTVRSRHRRAGSTPAVLFVGAAILAGAAGAGVGLLASTDDEPPREVATPPPPPPPVTVRAGALSLELPDGWSRLRGAPQLTGLSGEGSVAVQGERADVLIVKRRLEGRSLLPDDFAASLASPLPEPRQVRAGEHVAFHYANLLDVLPDARVDVFALPTTRGVATLACVAEVAAVGASEDCVTALERLQLRGVAALDAEPGVAAALSLRRIVTRLNATRLPMRRRLADSRYPTPRRRAAARLARAHDRAAAELAVMANTATDREIIGTLRGVAAAYRSYGDASARRDVSAARSAAQRLRTGERELARRLAARSAFRLDAT